MIKIYMTNEGLHKSLVSYAIFTSCPQFEPVNNLLSILRSDIFLLEQVMIYPQHIYQYQWTIHIIFITTLHNEKDDLSSVSQQ